VVPLVVALALASPPPPAWIERAHVAPPSFIVTWRLADVLGSRVVEGITVDRDPVDGTLDVSVVDSRFDPPRVVHQGTVKGSRVRWLRAGTRDGLHRGEIAVDAVDHGKETAYMLRVGHGFKLPVVRAKAGTNISPRVFASR
jgi:hypothetical protein